MTAEDPVNVRVTRRFSAPPEHVFDAWLDPEKAGRFLYATAEGEMVRVEIDARVGGRYSIVERRDGQDVEHIGEYLEIDCPHRLVFTLQVPLYSEEADRVTIEINPADGGCELTLVHETSPEWADQSGEGWRMILDTLASLGVAALPRHSPLFLIAGLAALVALGGVEPAYSAWPSAKCPHVVVLLKVDREQVRSEFKNMVVDPKPIHLEALGTGLDLLPEITCKAVRRVAFVKRPKAKTVCGWNSVNDRQDLLYFNVVSDSWYVSEGWKAKAAKCVAHESTHAAVRLLQSQQEASPLGWRSDRPNPGLWPADVQALALETIARAKLNRGVLRLWEQMHDAFVSSNLAAEYYGEGWKEREADVAVTREALAADGFASAYGGQQPIEDVAEISAWALARELHQATDTNIQNFNDAACSVMNKQNGASISKELSAVYVKLGFAHSVGLITEDVFHFCVAPLEILGNGPGFQSFQDGQPTRRYAGDVKRTLGQIENSGPYIFEMRATGTASTSEGNVPVQAVLQLDVSGDDGDEIDNENAPYPRGIYFVGHLYGPHNRFDLWKTADGTRLMEVSQGVLLVSRANRDLIEGSLFVQRYHNYAGGLLSAMSGAAAGGGDIPSGRTSITFRFEQ